MTATLPRLFARIGNGQEVIKDLRACDDPTVKASIKPNEDQNCANRDELTAFKTYLTAHQDSDKNKDELDSVNKMLDNFDAIDQYGAKNLGGKAGDGLISGEEFNKWNFNQIFSLGGRVKA